METKTTNIKKHLITFMTGGLLIAFAASAAHAGPVPARKSYVTDLTGTLTAAQKTQLNNKLQEFHRKHGPEIAVLIISTTKGENIETYSLRTANAWGLGSAARNDGVLMLVAKADRKMRIEVGKGLETRLTDARAARIIRENITPFFRQGIFYMGIERGLYEIRFALRAKASDGGMTANPLDYMPSEYSPPAHQPSTTSDSGGAFVAMVVIGLIVLICLSIISSATTSDGKKGTSKNSSAVNTALLHNSLNTTTTSSFTSGGFSGGGFDGGGSFGGGGASGDW